MKVKNQLIKIIKEAKGDMLGFGLEEDDILDAISKNKKLSCNLLNMKKNKDDNSEEGKKLKNISLQKLRKKFKKKNTDIIIGNLAEVKNFYSFFVKDSIYLTKGDIYLYSYEKNEIQKVIKKYERYHTNISSISCQDGIILKLDVKKVTSTRLKDMKCSMLDKIDTTVDIITEIIST